MAKKRRKRRARVRPGPPRPEQQPSAARQERKEQARKERERAIRQYRRQRILRRVAIWGGILAVVGGLAWFIYQGQQQGQEIIDAGNAAAERIGCGPVEEPPDEGADHVQQPPQYGTVPAASGPHVPPGSQLPPEPRVYTEPAPEFQAVHNLEHGYVMVWYRAEGQGGLPQPIVDALADVARDNPEVILAPHETGLEGATLEGTNLAFAAWTRFRLCAVDGTPEDAAKAAEGFITEFLNASTAPEAAAP